MTTAKTCSSSGEIPGEEGACLQLVDAMLSYVAMTAGCPTLISTGFDLTVQSSDRLHTDAEARQVHDESLEARHRRGCHCWSDEMRAQVELGAEGLVLKLQKQIEEQPDYRAATKAKMNPFKAEVAEVQRLVCSGIAAQ